MVKKTEAKTEQGSHFPIMSANVGDSFSGIYYVESLYVKLTVQQKKYTDLMLRDKSGARNVKYWGTVDGLESGDFVFVEAYVEDYQGNPSVLAKSLAKVDEPEDLSEYIASFENLDDYESLLASLVAVVAEIEAKVGQDTCTKLLGEAFNSNGAFWQRFLVAPAGESSYYGRTGGVLVNTVVVAENAIAAAKPYGFTNLEMVLLITSALVHKFGAVEAYEFEHCLPKATKKGILLGADNLTFNRISTLVRKVAADAKVNNKVVSQESILRIMHCITSYSSSSSVKPMTREAILLASVATNDSKMVESFEFIATDLNKGEDFTAFDSRSGRKYYRG